MSTAGCKVPREWHYTGQARTALKKLICGSEYLNCRIIFRSVKTDCRIRKVFGSVRKCSDPQEMIVGSRKENDADLCTKKGLRTKLLKEGHLDRKLYGEDGARRYSPLCHCHRHEG